MVLTAAALVKLPEAATMTVMSSVWALADPTSTVPTVQTPVPGS